jgi:predicted alpha/beta superfamily hydrolase
MNGITTTTPPKRLYIELFTPKDKSKLPVYITGNFNNWQVNDERFRMQKIAPDKFVFAFPDDIKLPSSVEYKFVRNGWEHEELDENGEKTTNRYIPQNQQLVRDFVPKWREDGIEYDPVFLPKGKVITADFKMPQLNKERRVSILLPYDYDASAKKYPVLYLQDGQNLFDDYAPYGNWAVNKRLAVLAEKKHHEVIIVAIDHGGADRIKEFIPYEGTKFGSAEGKIYARWMVETLKPFIDSNYRTLPDAANTGIGGSSMGGLISIYATLMYPTIFSKMMIFSPSLWITSKIYFDAIHFTNPSPTRIYLYAGGQESSTMIPNVQRFKSALEKMGYNDSPVEFKLAIDPKGQHNEERWGREFPKALEWLYY